MPTDSLHVEVLIKSSRLLSVLSALLVSEPLYNAQPATLPCRG